jgi:hypothetical protein
MSLFFGKLSTLFNYGVEISKSVRWVPLFAILREEVDIVLGFGEIVELDNIGMIEQLPSVDFIFYTVDDIAAFGLLVICHLDLSLVGGTFSSIFCLHIILHAKSVFGSSTVKWVIAKLPRPSSSFLMMYFPSITFRV